MRFKKNLSLIVLFGLLITTTSYGQIIRVKGGLNLSTMFLKSDVGSLNDNFKIIPGFHVGLTSEFPLNEMFSVETGLLLSTKGFKGSQVDESLGVITETDANMTLLYLDLPLTAKASFDVGSTKIYGALGPYLGLGLSGKNEYEITEMGETRTGKNSISWGSGEFEYNRLDYGLTAGTGVDIKTVQIGLFYSLGLANLFNDSDNNIVESKLTHRVLGFSMGYKFGRN